MTEYILIVKIDGEWIALNTEGYFLKINQHWQRYIDRGFEAYIEQVNP